MYAKQQCSTETRKLQIKAMLYFQRVGGMQENSGPSRRKKFAAQRERRYRAGGENFTSSSYSLANKALSGGIT